MTGAVKISEFTGWGDVALPDGGYVTFIYNGKNYKMSLANFLSRLGVSGDVVQIGDNGVAVVIDQGTTKAIRNINTENGIAITTDTDESILLSTDFSFDVVGAKLVDDINAQTLAFRSIVSGAGINVSESAGIVHA